MPFPPEVRAEAFRLLRTGITAEQAAKGAGISYKTMLRWAKIEGVKLHQRIGGITELAQLRVKRRLPTPTPPPEGPYTENGRLTYEARVLIGIRRREHHGVRSIARELGVAPSTVSRELARNSIDGGHYRAKIAHKTAAARRARPKPFKLAPGSRLRAEVIARLNQRHSPEQICGALRLEYPNQDDMQVSHETIYQALYVQGAGSLRHELAVEKATRQGRTKRHPRSKLGSRSNRSWIGNATITARPPEAADRAVPGHWEGDLVIGTDQFSALITLIERHSRFTLLSRLTVHDSHTVTSRLTEMVQSLPSEVFKTITWDQGVEMAEHAQFTVKTGCPVYFCDPHSPWQRPTNENTNGLIRDFFPKGTDFAQVTDEEVAHAQLLLNTRPRKVLGFLTPADKLKPILGVAPTT